MAAEAEAERVMATAAQRSLADAIEAKGLGRHQIVDDGILRRFTPPGDHKPNGWVVSFGTAGAFGCHKRGFTKRWSAGWSDGSAFTKIDRERIAEENAKRARIDAAVKAEAARRAEEIWEDAALVESHPYLDKKRVKAYGVRFTKDGALVIPARDADGKIHTVQFIHPDGSKIYLKGGDKRGHYHLIGEVKDRIIVVEGYATGATIHEATGEAVAVAFDAGNLAPVARAIREKYPHAHIVLAADDDYRTEGNPGRTKAQAAADEVDGVVVLPKFSGAREGLTDFNDLAVAEGLNKVRAQLMEIEVADVWSEPEEIADTLPTVEPFTEELLPEAFRGFVMDAAERIQCPPDFIAVATMVTAGSVIGRQIAIHPKLRDDWEVIPNVWGAIVGISATRKTPAMAEPLKFVKRLDAKASADFEKKIEEHNRALEIRALKVKAATKAAQQIANDNGDDDAIRKALEVTKIDGDPPARRRYFTNDCTVEKLGEILRANPNGILLERDELVGWLRSFEREGHEQDRAFFLQAANSNSDKFIFDRIGRGTTEIPSPSVSILGGIQPGPLKEYFKTAMDGGAGADGLTQRLQLMTWPDVSADFKIIDRFPNTAARDRVFDVFERLADLDPEALGAERDKYAPVPFLRFSADAQDFFYQFSIDLNRRLRSGNDSEALTSHLLKMERTVAALALICHLADSPDGGPVSVTALERALAWQEYLESHARRVYGACTRGDLDGARTILRRLEAGELPSTFTARHIHQKGWAGLTRREDVSAALDLLESYGWIRGRKRESAGRSTIDYFTHPKLRRGQ